MLEHSYLDVCSRGWKDSIRVKATQVDLVVCTEQGRKACLGWRRELNWGCYLSGHAGCVQPSSKTKEFIASVIVEQHCHPNSIVWILDNKQRCQSRDYDPDDFSFKVYIIAFKQVTFFVHCDKQGVGLKRLLPALDGPTWREKIGIINRCIPTRNVGDDTQYPGNRARPS
jgi:hypothetical protein